VKEGWEVFLNYFEEIQNLMGKKEKKIDPRQYLQVLPSKALQCK